MSMLSKALAVAKAAYHVADVATGIALDKAELALIKKQQDLIAKQAYEAARREALSKVEIVNTLKG